MRKMVDVRILLLVLSLFTNVKTTKLLSDQKKCGDPECAVSIIRVQAIKDYTGPDCRYLNFKSGEEIMVYFKLSRNREDLWAGSKGKDFGYFPMDAVQIEEVFVTEEVEVPTKETDFLCLDGGEYVFENEDSILNAQDEDNEYISLYTDQVYSNLNILKDKALEMTGISFPKDYKEPFPDSDESDSKLKDQHNLESTKHGNSEPRDTKTGGEESVQQEDQKSPSLKPVPKQAPWSVSGIAGWLSLGGNQEEEPAGGISKTAEQITFTRRKIAVTNDGNLQKLNDDGGTEPRTWFQSILPDFMDFRSGKTDFGLLEEENNPDAEDISRIMGDSDHDGSITAADTQEETRDPTGSTSNWFGLDISDVLTFENSNEDEVRSDNYEGKEAASKNEESLPFYSMGFLVDQLWRKQTSVSTFHREQDKTVQEITDVTKPDSKLQVANEVTDLKEATDISVSIESGDKLLESHHAEHNSVSDIEVVEEINIKAIKKESEIKNKQSGTTNIGKLSGGIVAIEGHHLNSDKEFNGGQLSEVNKISPVNIEENMCISENCGQLNLNEGVLARNLVTQNSTFRSAGREWLFQIILCLNDICDLTNTAFSFMMIMSQQVVAALPENVRPGPNLYGFPWEMVICCAVVALFIVFLLTYRSYQSVRSRLYVGREEQLAGKVAELVEEKCEVLEKLSLCKKEYEDLEHALKDASLLNESTSASDMKTVCEELSSSNSVLKKEIEFLEKELEEEKCKQSQQDDLMADIQRRIASLENEAKSVSQQIAEAKTTLKVYDINRERLRTAVQDAVEENSHLNESEKQLLQEAEGWGERFSELNEQTKIFESSKADLEASLKNKDSQVKSLTECLLKMKDWSSAIGEHDAAEDSYWDNDKEETENGEHLDDQEKRTIRKLIYAAKLNACLKSVETEKSQIYSKLTDETKAKEELTERIENLQREHDTLQSENTQLGSEVQKLKQKLKVISELYQENEMNLRRKVTVEEKKRLQKEEKLSKVDKRISHAAEELTTYRQRANDLEDELERTVRSYQSQIMSHEKKAHDNWLAARAAERNLNNIRKENSHNRQQLTEAEFKYDLLEKDPYGLDVPVRAFGREQFPYGPSPMGRPSSETRAFLSPPTLLEGPLRLSPVLPGGGGRGSRGPGNAGIYEAGNEQEDVSSGRLSNPHRPPSDSGSLSPPWDRERRVMHIPAGQLFNDQHPPPRRQEKFYPNPPNSGRLSGPADRRTYSMHSFDKADGHISESNSRMDLSGNGIKDHPNDSNTLNVPDHLPAPESETLGPGIVPPPLPLLRAPLMPMDPRGAFMRRGPPFPPVPPSGAYGPREYFPRDFAGLPRPLLPMRAPFPVRPFSPYPPSRAGFFPPPPPALDNNNELSAGLTESPTAPSTDNQEPQQET